MTKRNADSDLFVVFPDGRVQRRVRKGSPIPARLTGLVTLDEASRRQRLIHESAGALGDDTTPAQAEVTAPAQTEARAPAQTEARPGPITSGRPAARKR